MAELNKASVVAALSQVRYPGTGQNIVESGMLQDDIVVDGRRVTFSILFEKPHDPFAKSVVKAAEQAILTFVGEDVDIKGNITALFPQAKPVADSAFLPGVKHTVAIFSGKGGVGKSTISANLAVALAKEGYRVGVLDADIHGPSLPKMFGCEEARPTAIEVDGGERISPVLVTEGIRLLSIGFFIDPDKALVWRGAMASNALTQLLRDGDWGELDYLLIDLPPGTSDIHLTLVHSLALSGVIVVTTPQEVALADARKGIDMFTNPKLNVPVLGLVENMSWFTPAELPDNRYYIFGKGGGERLAREAGCPLLAQIPLVQAVCEAADAGQPIAADEGHILSPFFRDLAQKVHQACVGKS